MNAMKWTLAAAVLGSLGTAQAATSGEGELVAALNNTEASGIVVTPTGRTFLTLPRAGSNHAFPSVVELVHGKQVAFPDLATTTNTGKPLTDWLVSPLGLTLAGNTLWVLDEGKRPGIDGIPDGSAKLVGIDINSRKVTKTIVFHKPFMRDSLQLNDLRIDPDHGAEGTVYISNNGYSSPSDCSLIVVDLATGKMRELFHNLPQTSPAPGFMTYVEGQPHAYSLDKPTMPQGGVNGIELSPDHKKLYWTIPTNPNYYSIDTANLSDFNRPEDALVKDIHFEGQVASNGGIAVDDQGNLYFGDASRYSVISRDSAGQFHLVGRDARLIWPDGLYWQGGYLYVTVGQWQRVPGLHGGQDLRKAPYDILRFKTAKPAR